MQNNNANKMQVDFSLNSRLILFLLSWLAIRCSNMRYSCRHCGAEVNAIGRHALCCRKSEGRHHGHVAVNDIIHRTLVAAHVHSG